MKVSEKKNLCGFAEEPLEDDVQVAADLTKYLPCIEVTLSSLS